MKYHDLNIQTQREFPNNARTQGFGWLARAGYLTRENELTPLGKKAIEQIQTRRDFSTLTLIQKQRETFTPFSTGNVELIHCSSCNYVERLELAQFKKSVFANEEKLPAEKVLTPDCPTIESLANFLNIPKEKTAKALMFTRVSDNQFVFVVVRGDMTLSEEKLKNIIGEFRLASAEEISQAGAAAGYASPIGLKNALIVVDDLIPQSPNLAAGANESGYHLINTNHGRDYQAELIADLTLAHAGDSCPACGSALELTSALLLASENQIQPEAVLLALAEIYHDDKGLALPKSAAPFDVYLMHVPGKELDTRAKALEIYNALQAENIRVLFDDRDERAGVKFNDADLIGCPMRVTIGERGLKENKVEVKLRKGTESQMVKIDALIEHLQKC